MTPALSASLEPCWQKTIWRGEPAWTSTVGLVRAVVSERRERLIYLGAANGSLNLINAPYPQVLPDDVNRWPNQGGHRFWLGPQSRWIWPPPTEWEYSAAAKVAVDRSVLQLQQPRYDSSYPAITREYAWEGSCFRCTARWADDGRPYFGMHVIPVDLPFLGRARLVRTDAIPLGVVNVQLERSMVDGFIPHPAVELDCQDATLRGGRRVIKLGFAPQPLTIDRPGGWKLSVLPGPNEGVVTETPDCGYLSQIWVGGPEHDLAELEQLTPYLRADTNGECASTIYIEAIPPTA
jgi:hypothetical protein